MQSTHIPSQAYPDDLAAGANTSYHFDYFNILAQWRERKYFAAARFARKLSQFVELCHELMVQWRVWAVIYPWSRKQILVLQSRKSKRVSVFFPVLLLRSIAAPDASVILPLWRIFHHCSLHAMQTYRNGEVAHGGVALDNACGDYYKAIPFEKYHW
jgi:hypothetical protein